MAQLKKYQTIGETRLTTIQFESEYYHPVREMLFVLKNARCPFRFSALKSTIVGLLFILTLNIQVFSQTVWTQIGPKNPTIDIVNYDPNISGNGLVHSVMFEPEYNGTTKKRLFAWSYSGLWLSPSGQGNDWQNMNTDQLDDGSFSAIAINPHKRNQIIATTGTLSGIKFHSVHHRLEYKYSTGFWSGHFDSRKSKWKWTRIKGCAFKDNADAAPVNEADYFKYTNHRLMTNICFNSKNSKELLCTIVEMINPTDPEKETYKSYIYKSSDGGVTWIRKFEVVDFFLKDLISIGRTVFATGRRNTTYSSGEILFKSSDFGNKWQTDYCITELAVGNKDHMNFLSDFIYYNVSYSPANKGSFYLTGFTNDACQTLKIDITNKRSRPTLLPISNDLKLFNNNGKSDAFEVSPNDSNTFLYGGWLLGFVKYDYNSIVKDFPKYYGGFNNDFHQDIRDVTFNPIKDSNNPDFNSCIIACDGGVFKGSYISATSELIFNNISNGLEILNCTDITCTQNTERIDGRNIDEVIVNTWDNGLYKYTPTEKWIHSGTEGNEVTVNPKDYSKYYFQNFPADGNSYTVGYLNTISHSKSKIVYNPQNPKQFYLIDNVPEHSVILVTEDSSGRITETGLAINDNDLTAIDVCASNPNVIVVAKFFRISLNSLTNVGRLLWTTNGGQNWSIVDVPFSEGKLNEITDLVISSSNPNKVWVSDYSNKVAFTKDGGKNWETQLLPDEVKAIYCLYYLKGSNDIVFAGTSAGLYIYNASEKIWVEYNTYYSSSKSLLPRSIITGIDYNYNTETIFISTFGRGVWKGKSSKQ